MFRSQLSPEEKLQKYKKIFPDVLAVPFFAVIVLNTYDIFRNNPSISGIAIMSVLSFFSCWGIFLILMIRNVRNTPDSDHKILCFDLYMMVRTFIVFHIVVSAMILVVVGYFVVRSEILGISYAITVLMYILLGLYQTGPNQGQNTQGTTDEGRHHNNLLTSPGGRTVPIDSTALSIYQQISPEVRTQMLASMRSLSESKTMFADPQLNNDIQIDITHNDQNTVLVDAYPLRLKYTEDMKLLYGLSCAICLASEDYVENEDIHVYPCGHNFHAVCSEPWVHKGTCPTCRAKTN